MGFSGCSYTGLCRVPPPGYAMPLDRRRLIGEVQGGEFAAHC